MMQGEFYHLEELRAALIMSYLKSFIGSTKAYSSIFGESLTTQTFWDNVVVTTCPDRVIEFDMATFFKQHQQRNPAMVPELYGVASERTYLIQRKGPSGKAALTLAPQVDPATLKTYQSKASAQ